MMEKKKAQSALLGPLGRWTGNNFSFKGDLIYIPTSRQGQEYFFLIKFFNILYDSKTALSNK